MKRGTSRTSGSDRRMTPRWSMIALVAPVSAAALAGSVTWAVASPPRATAASVVANRGDEGRGDEGRGDEGRGVEAGGDDDGDGRDHDDDGESKHESERRVRATTSQDRVRATTSQDRVRASTAELDALLRDIERLHGEVQALRAAVAELGGHPDLHHDVRDGDDPDGDEQRDPRPRTHPLHRVETHTHPSRDVVRPAAGPHDDGSLVMTVTPHIAMTTRPLTLSFRAMASRVTLQVVEPGAAAPELLDAARLAFARVESSCTRFDPDSPLMRANAAAEGWHAVPSECYRALAEAALAHTDTGGLFDPRVLETLKDLGYDRSLPFGSGSLRLEPSDAAPDRTTDRTTEPWRPGFDSMRGRVRIGARPVDLGGIGKGLAVRWAAESLAYAGRAHLVEAGGDCHLGGHGPDGTGWRVAVEDPRGGTDPVAVLTLNDTGCATSSLRVRSWRLGGRRVHHLIDPRTGAPADGGLAGVTVVGADPARAEVWSKALLVAGRSRIAEIADRHALSALWIDEDGRLGWTPSLGPALTWVGADVA